MIKRIKAWNSETEVQIPALSLISAVLHNLLNLPGRHSVMVDSPEFHILYV